MILQPLSKVLAATAFFTLVTTPVLAATPVVEGTAPPAQTNQAAAAPAATPVAPPSAPAKLSAAELEKLLMPIALYPDPLLATILPASVYPLEVVQAARFLQDTNNTAKIDEQNWDESVKAVAKIPAALKKLNDDLQWTIQLGEVFLNQDKDVMDTIQSLRNKAQTAGTLRTSEQQTVVVTNMIVEKTVEQQVVTVTNTIVQIQPSNPQVVYVPSYPPTVYYPPPGYVYNPVAPLITFGAGVAMGAIIANNCDWHGGGCYWGGHGDINIDRDTNINIDRGDRTNIRGGDRTNVQAGNRAGTQGKKWQPDQNRVRSSGSTASQRTAESRGWGSGTGAGGQRASATQAGARNPGAAASTRQAGGGFSGAQGAGGVSRPSATTPSAGNRAAASPSVGNRSAASPSVGNRSAASPSVGGASARTPSASHAPSRSGGSSAFGGGGGGGGSQSFSNRGAASRGSGGFHGGGGGGARGGGGGGRGGGGGGGRR